MTADSFHAYTYDAEGNVTQVDGGATARYVYDALNHRVQSVTSSGTIQFVFNANGQRVSVWNGSTQTELRGQYYWGSQPVAFYAGGQTYFQHQDWLGTERMRTTYNGGVEATFTSLPFGDGLTTTSGTDLDAYHYALLDHDYESDTEHAQFRQYSSAQGHWMSPDPYIGSYRLGNPQSFNRYVYAANRPLAAVDPSGLEIPACTPIYCPNNSDGGLEGGGGAPGGEFFLLDWVSSSYGTYAYSSDVWDAAMRDGYGGGVTEDADGDLYDYNGDPVGNTWMSFAPTDSGTSQMLNGTVSTPNAPSNGQQKSPARQQCEANAAAKYSGAVGSPQHQFNVGLLIGAGTGALAGAWTGATRGAVAGCALTIEVGCFEGALGGAAMGAVWGGAAGAAGAVVPTVVGIGVNMYEAKQQYNQDMQTCSQL